METEEKPNPKKFTIQDYLEKKDKLLTAFSIFIALTLFSGELKIDAFSKGLSFIFLTISLLIWLELWTSFPSENRSWTLNIFENLLTYVTLGIVGYWIIEYKNLWKFFAFIVIAAGIASILSKLNDRFRVYDKIFQAKIFKFKIVKIVFGFCFIAIVIVLTLSISALLIGGISPLIDTIEKEIITGTTK